MRVGIVAEYYRPWPGGISEHVHHQAEELERRGHEVTIVTGPAPEGWVDEGRSVQRLGFAYEFTSNGALSRLVLGNYLLHFRRTLRVHHFDVLHVHAPMDPFLPIGAVYAAECPVVGTFHANFDPGALWDGLYRWARPLTSPAWHRLAARIAVAPAARESIGHYFDGEVQIVPNGVDTERFRPDVEKLPQLASPARRVLFVGRADPRKGLPILLRAFPEIRRRVAGAELVVVGVGEDEVAADLSGLDSEVRKSIRFEGYAAPEDMARYYASCDVFCSPATGQESQGIVLLEAMAAGRPPVAFAIPGYRDVVSDGVDGCLIEKPTAEALAERLSRLLDHPAQISAMGTEGRKTALQYSWPRVVQQVEAIYKEVCGRSSA
ncbi:MAG: glycosyltransferase family 4 protein [Myxococcota bacterium]|nr:glycosyltransferase family 4 protein [Myxococcota bacterium]